MRRAAASFVVGLVALLGALVGLAAPAQALPLPAAASCTGIWVVVDFGALGAGTQVECAPTYPNGTSALRNAGFDPYLDNGMIVKIKGLPTSPDTSQNYWSYWHATRQADGSYSAWSYSSLGANAFQPGPNDAEGWRYESVSGGYIPPSVRPPKQTTVTQAPATTTAPAPATTTRTTSAPKTTAAAVAPATTAAAAPSSSEPVPTPSDTPSASVSDSPTPSETPTGTPTQSSSPPTPSGTPAPAKGAAVRSLAGGLGAIGVIAAGAGGMLWWRKRAG